MNDHYQPIIIQFLERLEEIECKKTVSIKRIEDGIYLCNDTLYQLKNILEQNSFPNKIAEIQFFKTIKVIPLSALVYLNEVRSCELLMPKIGAKHKLSYLNKKKRRINKFFNKHCDFVYYMEAELSYLDNQYFTREHQVFPLNTPPESSYLDPNFFTSHDMLWARIKGMHKFVGYLKRRINEFKTLIHSGAVDAPYGNKLEWTASKVALTELIYALYTSKAINYGQKDIKTIATTFENLFEIKLDNFYKTYSEIKARKGARARFLQDLVYQFNAKMEIDDDY
ncbi:RteC domain-containing protein [Joostella sp.]|uniref:RteC domain-containing protein n=1 Tax=Joostella sp. TaxID=2231138 RepID=UPI003A8D1E66